MDTRVLYIFVDIKIDLDHLYKTITANFKGVVAVIGTIQFNSSVNKLKKMINLRQKENIENCQIHGKNSIIRDEKTIQADDKSDCVNEQISVCSCVSSTVPQIKPLSPGEVLGCTSPVISNTENVIYIGDGRFHLESAMIRNPTLNFYKYCPFTRKLTKEFYEFQKMKQTRESEIDKAFSGKSFGVILGSLGRQGNKQIMRNVIKKLEEFNKYKIYRIVVDEINEKILDRFSFIDSFVQISCPRLSIDWGACYRKPLLSPFEVFYEGEYKMDYYSSEGGAPWKNYNNTI